MNVEVLKIKDKKELKRILMLIFSLFFSAIVYNLFLLPVNLVTGGAGGIATITNYVYGIDPALMILVISLTCALLSFMYLLFFINGYILSIASCLTANFIGLRICLIL